MRKFIKLTYHLIILTVLLKVGVSFGDTSLKSRKMFKAVKNKSRLMLGVKNADADFSQTSLVFYYGSTFEDSKTFDLTDYKSLLDHKNFDPTKTTVLYIFGYLENLSVESCHVIVNAYLNRTDVNLILLDWTELADGNYMFDAVVNARQLGFTLAKTLIKMFNDGLNIEKFHLLGHSLGGQICGIIGRELYRISKKSKKIKRITALDPAFPLFYTLGMTNHLVATDAEFVDVIHTDAWFYGAPVSTGTADFWPNGGKTLQPGCPKRNYKMLTDNDLSSHRRSWWFWAESVANNFPDKFDAVKSNSWADFKVGKVKQSEQGVRVVMGHDCPTNISGDFYLQTNGITPFGRGHAGTIYVDPKELVGNTYVEPNA